MTRRFVIGVILATPIVVLDMGAHLEFLKMDRFVPLGAGMWIQFCLATPIVLWCALPFFQRAWASITNRSPNMFTLIALGRRRLLWVQSRRHARPRDFPGRPAPSMGARCRSISRLPPW
jgi:Cu+-exporting ATPase